MVLVIGAFPVSFGPKALDVYSQADCKEHGILFLGQKSHAAYACVIPLMHWFSTYDKEYALENYYDFTRIAEIGDIINRSIQICFDW